MNNDETHLSQYEEEYVTKTESYSTVPSALQSVPPKYEQLDLKGQTQQCCMSCNNRPKNNSKFDWRHLLSYLPFRMKNASSTGPAGLEAVAASKSKPNSSVQICNAHKPIHSGHQHMNQASSEKRCSKRASYERIISNYNFDEVSTDQKSICDPCTQKAESVNNTKHIQVGVYEVSSHKAGTRACICSKKQAQKTSANAPCQQSLLEQAWEYIQSIIFTHRSGCPRCNQTRPPCPNPKPQGCPNPKPTCPNYKPPSPKSSPCVNRKTSKDSSCCKESLFELAKAYLKKITSEHKSGCPRCAQQPTCSSKETSFLQNMLEQAWSYIKKSCEQKTCLQQGALSCCTHPSSRAPVCVTPGILKYPSDKSRCCCTESSLDCPEKKSCQKVSCPKPVSPDTKICPEQNTPPVPPCRSEEEGTHEHKSCCTPCCIHTSQGVQPSYTSRSHHKSCCLSQLSSKPPKLPSCTEPCKDSTPQSVEEPQDQDHESVKHSSASLLGREIMGYHSSTQCNAPCSKDPNDGHSSPGSVGSPGRGSPGSGSPKQGLSLTMEPKDHKYCTRPEECKHSKESLENMADPTGSGACKKGCPGHCNVPKEPTFEQEAQTPTLACPGGCSKCTSIAEVLMYREHRMVDAEYEAFLDEQFGRLVPKQLLDKETICDSGCSCLTCIANIQSARKESKSNRKDPHNYRYYY